MKPGTVHSPCLPVRGMLRRGKHRNIHPNLPTSLLL
jgi:hypothetical protein